LNEQQRSRRDLDDVGVSLGIKQLRATKMMAQ
jgi:hypothetical protein